MTEDIDAKVLVPYPASIWHLLSKFKKNPLRNFWEKGVVVTSYSPILGQKAATVCKLLECARLKQNTIRKRQKTQHWARYNPAISDVWYFWILTLKTKNFKFSKISAYKIQNFGVIQKKKRKICCNAIYKQHTCQITMQYLYFWLCSGKKTVRVMASLFEMQLLAFLSVVR